MRYCVSVINEIAPARRGPSTERTEKNMKTQAYYFAQTVQREATMAFIRQDSAPVREYRATEQAMIEVNAAAVKLGEMESKKLVADLNALPLPDQMTALLKIVKESPVRMRAGGMCRVPEHPGLFGDDEHIMMSLREDADDDYECVGIKDKLLAAELARLIGRDLPAWRGMSIGEMATALSGVGVNVVNLDDGPVTEDEHEED